MPSALVLLIQKSDRFTLATKKVIAYDRRKEEKRQIPQFQSIAEEAAFWDTHSVADYRDTMKPVQVHFAKNLSEGITIRLEATTLAELRRYANEQGIGPTTLMRMWILERLKEVKSQHRTK